MEDELILIPPSSSFPLSKITDMPVRSELLRAIEVIDTNSLTVYDSNRLIDSVCIALSMFAQKIEALETGMERMYRQQQSEIQELRTELENVKSNYEMRIDNLRLQSELAQQKLENKMIKSRSNNRNVKELLKLGEMYKDHKYGPYAIKGVSEAIISGGSSEGGSEDDQGFVERLAEAQANGFKWDARNREPSRMSKKLEKLVQWEEAYNHVYENVSLEDLKNPDYFSSYGAGIPQEAARSAATLRLQEALPEPVEFHPHTSVANRYKKLVKSHYEPDAVDKFVSKMFSHLEVENRTHVAVLIRERGLNLRTFKRIMSKSLLPPQGGCIDWGSEELTDDQKLVSVYHGEYDSQVQAIMDEVS